MSNIPALYSRSEHFKSAASLWLKSRILRCDGYIAQDSTIAAAKTVKKILRSIDILTEQPGMGRPGRVLNTRELVVPDTPYIVPYRVKNNVIEILRVFHCSMQWPD